MSKLKIFITISLTLMICSVNAFANNYTREDIKQFAKDYVEQTLPELTYGKRVISPANIDPRISIKPCSIPLQANIPENYRSRNVNVKIFCSGSTPWHIFLPVKVTTQIPVLVAQTKIAKGTMFDSSNVTTEWRELHQTRGEVITKQSTVYGAKSKRNLNQGAIITKKMFCVVCKGDNVTIKAKTNNLVIKTQGVAQTNGIVGEQIRVKNSRSGRSISAQVAGINHVVINL